MATGRALLPLWWWLLPLLRTCKTHAKVYSSKKTNQLTPLTLMTLDQEQFNIYTSDVIKYRYRQTSAIFSGGAKKNLEICSGLDFMFCL